MDESSPRKMRALRSNRSSESLDTNADDASDVAPDLERRTSTPNETSQTLGLVCILLSLLITEISFGLLNSVFLIYLKCGICGYNRLMMQSSSC
jgi:hypothetical protein